MKENCHHAIYGGTELGNTVFGGKHNFYFKSKQKIL